MAKGGYVYFMSNKTRTTLYIGVTSDLAHRTWQHRRREGSVFASKYNCTELLYFEFFEGIEEAIEREKVLKKWKRSWKDDLIKEVNPELRDLYEDVRDHN